MMAQYAVVAYVKGALGEWVENLRAELHPEHAHLPTHISVLPPRPLHGTEAEALEFLSEVCSRIQPFEIWLGDVESFMPTTPTVFIRVARAAYKMRELHDALNRDVFDFEEQLPYMPHMTIAKLGSLERASEVFAISRERWNQYKDTRSFVVESLTFVRGRDLTWTDLAPVSLGGHPVARK